MSVSVQERHDSIPAKTGGGPGQRLESGKIRPPDVQSGDRVLIGKYVGSELTLDGEEHLILREGDVLGVLE
ncbi:MAG: hypothetical protein JRG92_21860 [Deltaproteobacteria bacterium]|nr:hypothetical protein [Deltaproteobacteria bacterium]MBW2386283.1 hypothetical protein [Deltaproteobacteria bacterium]MBW2695016.1 hypothetical protein [Deltaproteobacteria bacterium]